MKKIYIVIQDWGYDGQSVVGAYFSRDKAEQAAQEYRDDVNRTGDFYVDALDIEDGEE